VVHGSFLPGTLSEAIPFIVWIVLIVAAGHSGIAALVHGELWPCVASFSLLAGMTAAFIYWRQIKRWGPLSYALATLLIVVSVRSPVWDRLFPSSSSGAPDQTQLQQVREERNHLSPPITDRSRGIDCFYKRADAV
jgi:hypothetical protein